MDDSHPITSLATGIIEGMMNHEMNVKAIEVVYTFGVEDKFSPQTILNSFLRQSTELWNKMKGEARGSLTALVLF